MHYINIKTKLEQNIGSLARRNTWEEGCYIYFVPGSTFKVNRAPLNLIFPMDTEVTYAPHIDYCCNYQDKIVTGVFEPSSEDLIADDFFMI